MNNIVILDVETTGADYLLDEICQMSYIVVDRNFNVVKAKNFFFMVDYVHFKSNKKKLNIDELRVMSNNKIFKESYDEIFNDLNNNLIVCHKCEHDINFLKSEFMRVNNKNNFVYEEFCTMKYYTNILKIPSENFGYKYPKLIEIMPYINIKRVDINNKSKEIFNLSDNEINFHDSRVDVVATYLVASKTDQLINEYEKFLTDNLNTTTKDSIDNAFESQIDNNINLNDTLYSQTQIDNEVSSFKSQPKKNIFKELFSFKGNINSKIYRSYLLLTICMYLVGYILIDSTYMNTSMTYDTSVVLLATLSIVKGYILVVIVVKRLRNIKKSVWMVLLLLIPIVNLFMVIKLCVTNKIDINNLDGKENIKEERVDKKVTWLIRGLILIIFIFIIKFISDDIRDSKIIEIVENYEEESGYTVQELIDNTVQEDDEVHGWYIDKIDSDTYFVGYEYYDGNGYDKMGLFAYEYYKPTDEVTVIKGDLAQTYIDLGYLVSDSNTLTNGLRIINTTYHTLQPGEVGGRTYAVDKQLAEENTAKNKELNPKNYNDEYERILNDNLVYTGGKRATVYVVEGRHDYHITNSCEGIADVENLYKIFLDDAVNENRTMCKYERRNQ